MAALRFRVAAAFLAEALRCFLVWAMRVLSVGCVNTIIAVLCVRPWKEAVRQVPATRTAPPRWQAEDYVNLGCGFECVSGAELEWGR
jgi:hypothetical protein